MVKREYGGTYEEERRVLCVCVIRYDRTDYSQDMNDRRGWEWKKDLLRTNRVSRCVDVQRGDSHVSCRVQEIIASSLMKTHIYFIYLRMRGMCCCCFAAAGVKKPVPSSWGETREKCARLKGFFFFYKDF